jgi:DNA-binding NtrC family response regulator
MDHPNVLVVDDDENILSAFRDFLRRENCSAVTALSAEEALKEMDRHTIDLVITDVRLKSQSGITFFMRLKSRRRDLPVIVITGYPNLIGGEEVKALGADYFFLKPLELDKLREAVRRCLHLNSK